MTLAGIVRRIDELGRIVVPKEIRRTLRIREGDPLEVYTDREGEIILKKYSPVGEISNYATQYAKVLSETTGKLVCISDKDHVIAAYGAGKKEFENQPITQQLEKAMEMRKDLSTRNGDGVVSIVSGGTTDYASQVIAIVNVHGDALGTVILMGQEKMTELEETLVKTTAVFLGSIMED